MAHTCGEFSANDRAVVVHDDLVGVRFQIMYINVTFKMAPSLKTVPNAQGSLVPQALHEDRSMGTLSLQGAQITLRHQCSWEADLDVILFRSLVRESPSPKVMGNLSNFAYRLQYLSINRCTALLVQRITSSVQRLLAALDRVAAEDGTRCPGFAACALGAHRTSKSFSYLLRVELYQHANDTVSRLRRRFGMEERHHLATVADCVTVRKLFSKPASEKHIPCTTQSKNVRNASSSDLAAASKVRRHLALLGWNVGYYHNLPLMFAVPSSAISID